MYPLERRVSWHNPPSKLRPMSTHPIKLAVLIAGLALCSNLALSQNYQGSDSAPPSISAPTLSQEQIRDLIRRAAEKDIANEKQAHNYTYIERVEEHKLDGDGQIKSTESKTYEVMALYGEQVHRLVEKDDKPLSGKDAAKEEEKIQKLIDKRKNESDDDRKKRLEKEEKQQAEDREFVKEIADAYNFRFAGLETRDSHSTYVIDADPRPGFEPHMKDAKFLPKFRFRVWIDQAETQWIKLDIQCVETVSVGLFLVRIHQGSNIQIEQTRVNDEVWLPKHIALKLNARVLLFKGLNVESNVTYRDYKKFRTGTKIVPAGEAAEQR
jgi:hypothetical protein